MEKQAVKGYPSADKPWLKFYSSDILTASLPQCTVYEYVLSRNKDHLSDFALEYFGKNITYGQLFKKIDFVANAFASIGAKAGDIVSICSITTPEIIYTFYALNKIGAICNMIDPRTNADGIKNYLNETKTKILVLLDIAYTKIDKILKDTFVEKVIVVSASQSMPILIKMGYKLTEGRKVTTIPNDNSELYISWKKFVSATKTKVAPIQPYKKDSPAVIIHTGGTTGTAKGVILSNDNINIMVVLQEHSQTRMDRGDSFLGIMPPFIAYGLICGISNPLCLGLKIIIIPKFVPSKFAELFIKYKPNHALGVPSYWEDLAKSSIRGDLSFIKNAITGGDRLSPEVETKINKFFSDHHCKYRLSKGYGMTELSSTATYSVCDECNLPESVGIPLFLNNIKIVEPGSQRELGYNEQGEICITSPTLMLGYYNNQEETNRTLIKHEDGNIWIHTGDIGYINTDGVVFLVDRMKRMIAAVDGFKIYPSLIENIIAKHEAVESCAVVGIPDIEHKHGMKPKAFIVLKEEYRSKENDIRTAIKALCEKELSEYAVPGEYVFCKELPLTPVGKIDFRALQNQ